MAEKKKVIKKEFKQNKMMEAYNFSSEWVTIFATSMEEAEKQLAKRKDIRKKD